MNHVEFFILREMQHLNYLVLVTLKRFVKAPPFVGGSLQVTERALGESSDVKSPQVLICLAQTVVMLQVLLSLLPKPLVGSCVPNGQIHLLRFMIAHQSPVETSAELTLGLGDVHPGTRTQHEISPPCNLQPGFMLAQEMPHWTQLVLLGQLFPTFPARSWMQDNV